MISETRRFALSNVLMLVSLGMLVFTFTVTHGTDCARAAGGSCAVGDTEVISNDLGIGGDLEFEGTSVDDFETKITATNPTADRTITLPDASGTLALAGGGAATVAEGGTGVTTLGANGVLVGDGTNSVNVTAAGSAGQVLTSNGAGSDPTFQSAGSNAYIDNWRVAVTFTGSQEPIASDWEQNDSYGFAPVGASMSESSGVFTFPVTGVWAVRFYYYFWADGAVENASKGVIQTSTDGGVSWDDNSRCTGSMHATYSVQQHCTTETIFNVLDTASELVRFEAESLDGTNKSSGNTNINYTHAVFEWIGNP